MEKVKLFSSPTWPHCKHAKEFLSAKGVDYIEYDVTQDPGALQEMVKISGVRSVPVIVGCEQVVVGFDQGRLEQMINCIKQRSEI